MNKFFTKTKVISPHQIVRKLHNHEVFLDFNNGNQAKAFLDWFYNKGLEKFEKWCDKNSERYEK